MTSILALSYPSKNEGVFALFSIKSANSIRFASIIKSIKFFTLTLNRSKGYSPICFKINQAGVLSFFGRNNSEKSPTKAIPREKLMDTEAAAG